MQPSTVNGTELGAQEWRDSHFLKYSIEPLDLPKHFDVCNSAFSVYRTLKFNRGGVVKARHNELRDRVVEMAVKYFTLNHMRDNPLTFAGCAVKRTKVNPARSKTTPSTQQLEAMEQKGDPSISDL